MRASSVLRVSIFLFIIMTSLYQTSEGFVASLTARREQLKKEKKKERLQEERVERSLQKLENREKAMERKLRHLREWVKKYKSKHRSKVSRVFRALHVNVHEKSTFNFPSNTKLINRELIRL